MLTARTESVRQATLVGRPGRRRPTPERDVTTPARLPAADASDSLSARAYRHLHDQILNGHIAVGDVISEQAVAKQLGISRTPVGEAVRLLAREGLVHQVPRYGTVVRQIDRADLEEHYEFREALESYAAQQAASRASATDRDRIAQLCEATGRWFKDADRTGEQVMDEPALRRFLAADMAFHLAIVQAAGNRQIMTAVHSSRSIMRIFSLRRKTHDRRLVLNAYEQHGRIAAAIAAGDGPAAAAVMLEHIRQSKATTLEQYDAVARRGQVGMPGLPADVLRELNEIEELLADPPDPSDR